MNSALQIAYIIISILIVILVLSQKAKDNGFTTMSGSSNGGREVGKTFEKKLQNWTTWLVVIYIILSIAFTFLQLRTSKEEQEAFTSDDIYQVEATNPDDVSAGIEEDLDTPEVTE